MATKHNLASYGIIALGLALTIVIIYLQVGTHQFLNYDDDLYITGNHNIQAGISSATVKWAFTTTYASNYHPLTWLSHMVDFQLFGLNPKGHHLVNVAFHILNTLLLFFLLFVATSSRWKSAMVAALFACHPLHVESVAWVAERKDLLSTLFWFLTLMSYHYYLQKRSLRLYILIVVCFMMGLMAKPMLVTLPFTLLLLDYWPYNRWLADKESIKQIVKEKIPLFALSLIACLTTYYAQHQSTSVVALTDYNFIDRTSNAAISYVSYLNKTIWPSKLSIFYPYPDSLPILTTVGAVFFLTVITYYIVMNMRSKPYMTVGWLWYIGTLVPVIGLVQVGEQAMADRYTYIPLLGIFIILVWGASDFFAEFKEWHNKGRWVSALAITLLVIHSGLSLQQTKYWQNDVEVFRHAIEVTEKNYLAHFQLGTAYARTKEFNKAEKHLRETIRLKPGTAQAYNNLAYVLERQGNIVEAITNYRKSVTLDPSNKDAHYNLGIINLRRWELEQAIHHLQRVLEISPNSAKANKNLIKAKKLLSNQRNRKSTRETRNRETKDD